jgi:hypothetical protein
MKACLRQFVPLIALSLVLIPTAKATPLEIKTLDGRTYKNCQLLEVQPDRIRIMHSAGIQSLDFEELPEQMRRRFGYDPAKAAKVRQRRSDEEKLAAGKRAIITETAEPDGAKQQASVPMLTEEKPLGTQPSASSAQSRQNPPQPIERKPATEAQRQPPPGSTIQRRIALSPVWDSKMQGGSEAMHDLHELFAPHAKPSAEVNLPGELMLADGIPYLCPLRVAEARLNVTGKMSSRTLVATPGFPRDSIFHHSYDGQFEGHYNRMYILVDAADQLLSVALVDESPKHNPSMRWQGHWFCYNFVNYRVKTISRLAIAHQLKEIRRDVFRVDSGLRDPGVKGHRGKESQHTLELSRWYVPRPLVQLILHCVSKASG